MMTTWRRVLRCESWPNRILSWTVSSSIWYFYLILKISSRRLCVDKPGMGAKTSKLLDFLEVDFTRKVIISWSLGNQAGGTNSWQAHRNWHIMIGQTRLNETVTRVVLLRSRFPRILSMKSKSLLVTRQAILCKQKKKQNLRWFRHSSDY